MNRNKRKTRKPSLEVATTTLAQENQQTKIRHVVTCIHTSPRNVHL